MQDAMATELVTHHGGCHCKAVRFEVLAPKKIVIMDCNCSICHMKGNDHFIVPEKKFKLVKGEDCLTTYRFNTMQAQHTFCKICGVQSFYRPRSNPDGYGVNPRCLDEGTVDSASTQNFDGQNWEQSMEDELVKDDGGIKRFSKA